MWAAIDFASDCWFLSGGAGVVVLISSIFGEETFREWGWRILFFRRCRWALSACICVMPLEETPAFQQHVEDMKMPTRNRRR